MRISAVIYIPCADLGEDAALCLEYAAEAGYHMAGLVVGRFEAAWALALAGVVQVVIVADRSQLPPDRLPRIEIPSEMARQCRPEIEGPPSSSPMRRRPRPLD